WSGQLRSAMRRPSMWNVASGSLARSGSDWNSIRSVGSMRYVAPFGGLVISRRVTFVGAAIDSWRSGQKTGGASDGSHSVAIDGQLVDGLSPVNAQISARSTVGGAGTIVSDGVRPFIAASITEWKIGPAPVTPLECRSSVRP